MTYDEWFNSQQGIPYDSSWLFAKAAWEHQADRIESIESEVKGAKDANESKSNLIDDVVKACSEAEKLAIERAGRIEALEQLAKEMAEAVAVLRLKTDPKYGAPVADKALSRYREVCGGKK